jgi:hypothetical protein
MNIFKKSVPPEKSWGTVLKKYEQLPQICLENLNFSSLIIPGGFPAELILKNSYSKVCVYDNYFDVNVGDASIEYLNDVICVRTALSKEQFNYLCFINFSTKKFTLKFLTPMLGEEIIKNTSFSEKIILKNCNIWVENHQND